MGAAAWAGQASDIRAGQALAEKACSPCHVLGERPGPPFAEIARGGHATRDALRALLHSTQSNASHPNAMTNPELTERQIDEISAYIISLSATK
jgi:mono/diheme cytochrome c family protein